MKGRCVGEEGWSMCWFLCVLGRGEGGVEGEAWAVGLGA